MPTVSVVIPSFNMGPLIGEAVESVARQYYRDLELVIVDDGSVDNTREVVGRLRDRLPLTYIYQNNLGLAAARNTGIGACQGRYVAILDADDSWQPDKLAKQVAALEEHPEVGLAYSDLYFVDVRRHRTIGIFRDWGGYDLPEGWVFRELLLDNFISSPTAVIPRSVLDRVGPFDDTVQGCEDWDMWLRISAQYPVLVIREPLATYNVRPGSMSKNVAAMYLSALRVQERALRLAKSLGIEAPDGSAVLAGTSVKHGAIQLSRGRMASAAMMYRDALKRGKSNPQTSLLIFKSVVGLILGALRQ